MTEKTNQQVNEAEANLPEKLFDGAETTPTEEKRQTLTVKYNGEEREISLEEAVVLAQKGMNYDHVVAERDSKYKRELDVLDRYAAMSGMSREEYLRRLEEEKTVGDGREDVDMTSLYAAYPELASTGLPEDVISAVRGGENPLHAYQSYKIAYLTGELEREKFARSARERTIGSLRGDALTRERDPFLEGFGM